MELKYLNTFRTVIQTGSFSKAAETLNYTQSTITFQIGQLENEFGTRLFEKIGRNMTPTKAAYQLLPYVEKVLSSVDKMNGFKEDLSQYRGEIRIGVGETLLCYKLPSIIKEFHRRAPNAQLYIRSMNCYDIRDAILNGELDIGVFYKDVGVPDSIETVDMGSYGTVAVMSASNANSYRDLVTCGSEIPLPFLINESKCIFRQIFENYLREHSIRLDRTIELWSIPTIINLVKNDFGITYLPRFAVEKELLNGELTEIKTEPASIHAVCGYHKNKWLSPAMELFIELCQKGLA